MEPTKNNEIQPSKKRHVIFLGAGASKSSGYPLANELRLRLSTEPQLLRDMEPVQTARDLDVVGRLPNYLDNFKDAMRLFREGGFATVDEFSKLASVRNIEYANKMKKLTQLALGLHNPEAHFEKSDYYAFIQRLFDANVLDSFRNDVTVLSYNYDCYLDYLLLRGFYRRQFLADRPDTTDFWRNKLTSGFYEIEDTKWADDTFGFGYFKLHGSIGYGLGVREHPHDVFFGLDNKERLLRLMSPEGLSITPPIVFPWEVLDKDGYFIPEAEFIFVKGEPSQPEARGKELYNLYKRIWTGAREAVQQATKISFVGLSAHEYMAPGFRFLFKGKSAVDEMVVANPEHVEWKDPTSSIPHPESACGRMHALLERARFMDKPGIGESLFGGHGPWWWQKMRPRTSFQEFILKEMN